MLNFAAVKQIVIPEGNVIAIDDENNVRIWQAAFDAIVNGVSPLTLPSAVRAAVVYLKQQGVCEQNGIPTPINPVDIKCNNGAIKYKDRELPVGFIRLLDINFDGGFHYITNEKLYGSDDVSMTINNISTSGQNLFGSYAGAGEGTKNFSLYVYGSTSSQCYFRYGERLYRPRLGTGERSITFGESGTTGFYDNVSITPETFESNSVAWIGMLPNSSSSHFIGTIEGNIVVSNRLKYIPCKRLSDGVIGYYEVNNEVFLEPRGSGTPTTTGIDDSQMELVIVGTKEVISINNQTASAENLFAINTFKDEQDIISGNIIRKCGVIVLNGSELERGHSFNTSANCITIYIKSFDEPKSINYAPICTHFVGTDVTSISNMPDNSIRAHASIIDVHYCLNIRNTNWSSVSDYETFVKSQYEAGTPVIVIYPLVDETTEQVTPQPLNTIEGDDVVTVIAEVSNIPLEVKYKRN